MATVARAAAGSAGSAPAAECCLSLSAAPLSDAAARGLAAGFAALSDPVRLRVLSLIAASDELVGKSANPHVPYGPEEVAADAAVCVEAGATLVHFHARDAESGEQRWHDDALYTDAVARMRALGVGEDVPWYPTYPGVRP